jgi:spermidine synthase
LALGASITRRWKVSFGVWLGIAIVGMAWLLGGFAWVTTTYAGWHSSAVDQFSTIIALKAGCVAVLMLVPATAFGGLIPALLGEAGEVARDSGRLLCVSSLANAAGFLLMAFVLHQHLDYGVMLLLIAGLGALALLIQARFRPLALISAVVLIAAPLTAYYTWWNERTLYFGYHFYQSAGELRRARSLMTQMQWFKGRQDVFSLNRYGEDDLFFINGYISNSLQAPAEKMVSIFPAMFAPRTDRALVLGVGSGATAGAAALAFDQVDAVEINPVVLENLDRMAEHNFRIAQRMNVRFILDDGIHHIKTNAQRYPIIVNTVTSPRYFSSAKLYTRDFFETVRARLEPDGLYVAWIDGTIGNRGLDIILKTASQSFKECSVGGLTYGYFLLVCSQEPIRLRHPELARRTELASYFRRSGVTAELLPYSLLTTRAYGLIADSNAPINTLDFPALEFEMSRVGDRPVTHFTDRLEQQMDLAQLASALQPAIQFDPLRFALCSELLFEKTTLSQHALRLAAAGNEDFQENYRALKLAHLAATAEAARTPAMWHLYAKELLAQRRYGEAIATERLALAASPERSGSWAVIGASQEKISAWPEAIQSYRNELKLDQNDGPALFGLGRVYFKMERYAEALEFLQQSRAAEERPEIRYYLGMTLEALGRTNEAKAEFERGLRGGGK